MDKEFERLLNSVSYSFPKFTVWDDFVHMAALAISNSCNYQQTREDTYLLRSKKYNAAELDIFTQMFARTVMALDKNREQDFLGQLYMEFGFGDPKKGQYFTPYNIAELMSMITNVNLNNQPYVTVNDPTSGSGVMLIAAINKLLKEDGNPHTQLFIVAQDLDPCIAMMCYIQLSLLGGAGYVVVGDSICTPLTGNVLVAPSGAWCTPMYYHPVWKIRRGDI